MIQAAHTLFDWWHHVTAIHHKYGTREGIEGKPEWVEFQRLRKRMFQEMHEDTGIPEKILDDSMQLAIMGVMGTAPTTLTRENADAVVVETIRLGIRHQIAATQLTGMRN